MTSAAQVLFPPYRLDLENEQLFRGTEPVHLRAKTFAVLRHLVERGGRLVTRADLVRSVWQGAHGSDQLPKGCVRELRDVLGDDAAAPRFIESLGRRGYRFIAPIAFADGADGRRKLPWAPGRASLRVGRETEIATLLDTLERGRAGERQVVFVTGEPGIGKTTVVDAFRARIVDAWIAQGQCVESYGHGEAYLPILDALGRLCRQPGTERLIGLLRHHAPTWLVQMPALISEAEMERLQLRVQGATPQRMLREIGEFFEVLATERPFVLILEDLQWSDRSTVHLIAAIARQRMPTRMLLLGTYRPADLIVSGHALKTTVSTLRANGQCRELALDLLTPAEVAQYVSAIFPEHEFPPPLTAAIHRCSDGNPLFMVNTVENLVARGQIFDAGGRWRLAATIDEITREVPQSIRELIASQIDRLATRERHVLEAASVAGAEFSATAVARALNLAVEEVEECCEALVMRGAFLDRNPTAGRADGSLTARYVFLHSLYAKVLYERLPIGYRVRLHHTIAEHGERVRDGPVAENAAQLALHFERAHDHARAIPHLHQAATNALRRSAHEEAIEHLQRALTLLRYLPEASDRVAWEIALQAALGRALIPTHGFTAREVERAFGRARELSRRRHDVPVFPIVHGLHMFHLVRAHLPTARELGRQCLEIAQRTRNAALRVEAHLALGQADFYLGRLEAAAAHLQRVRTLYDPDRDRVDSLRVEQDPAVSCRYHLALTLWLRGYPDRALVLMREALALAEACAHPFTRVFAFTGAAVFHLCRRETKIARKNAQAALAIAAEHGFGLLGAYAAVYATAAPAYNEHRVNRMEREYAAIEASGARLGQPHFLCLLAEANGMAGRFDAGLAHIGRALTAIEHGEQRWWQAEVLRLRGELLLARSEHSAMRRGSVEVERYFRQAITVARRQGALMLALRAATSLARMWHRARRTGDARRMLGSVYRQLREGFASPDVATARALLDELESMSRASRISARSRAISRSLPRTVSRTPRE